MYLFYEHHKDASGTVLATQMLCSSFLNAKPGLNWRSDTEKAFFALVKDQFFKAIPLAERSYDNTNHIWTFLGTAGERVFAEVKASPLASIGVQLLQINDLETKTNAGFIPDPAKKHKMPKAEDFFYNNVPQGSPQMTKESALQKLAVLCEVEPSAFASAKDELKKIYRKAALRLHPDRNNGDGSRMSELNSLWQVFNS